MTFSEYMNCTLIDYVFNVTTTITEMTKTYEIHDMKNKNSLLMNKTVSDPDMSTIERENQFKRKPLSSARSNNDVSSTPTPTPRRVSRFWSFKVHIFLEGHNI